ncbi:MAG: glycosyltransferase, partial [Candidatus Methylacidiphilales bacterium]
MEIFHIITLGSLSLLILNYLLNLKVFRFPPPSDLPAPAPFISVLIPARNEEKRIRPCLGTLVDSNYPHLEILVLDDHSSDGTADLVRKRAQGDSRVRLLTGQELPSGWTGKAWACHQLAQAAKGEFLVFVDADTRFSDITLSQAVSLAV